MFTIHRSRLVYLGSAVVFAFTLLAPGAVSAQEEVAVTVPEDVAELAPVVAPAVAGTSADAVRATRALAAERALLTGDIGSLQEEHLRAIVAAAPSWDETSGYGSVEDSRAAASALLAPVAAPSWDETSGYGAVEASRATIGHPAASTTAEQNRLVTAQHALQGGDLGSLQEDALLAVVFAGQSWDETSGYGSVEASRAANALPVAPASFTTQVPADVRWAPARVMAPESSVDTSRAFAAQQALLSQDLGGVQEDALTAVVEASRAEVDASVDEAPVLTSAELLGQFRAIELSLSRYLEAN